MDAQPTCRSCGQSLWAAQSLVGASVKRAALTRQARSGDSLPADHLAAALAAGVNESAPTTWCLACSRVTLGGMAYAISLSTADFCAAVDVAAERMRQSARQNLCHSNVRSRPLFQRLRDEIYGCCAELAVARFVGVRWSKSVNTFRTRPMLVRTFRFEPLTATTAGSSCARGTFPATGMCLRPAHRR